MAKKVSGATPDGVEMSCADYKKLTSKKYYVLEIFQDVESYLYGPFANERQQLERARGLRANDPEKHNGLYRLLIENGLPTVADFSGGELED